MRVILISKILSLGGCDTYTDHGDSVEQRDDQKHFSLQHRRQLRLSCRTFEEATAQEPHADSDAQRTQADQNRDGDRGVTNYSFHQCLLFEIKSKSSSEI
jgi:hypothetical protein